MSVPHLDRFALQQKPRIHIIRRKSYLVRRIILVKVHVVISVNTCVKHAARKIIIIFLLKTFDIIFWNVLRYNGYSFQLFNSPLLCF